MKQELVEFRAFRYNPWTADAKGVFCLQLYKFSAFQKTNHKKEKTTAENNCGKRVGGIECSPLLRTRGRSAEEGRGSLLLKGRWRGCLQVRDPASAPALVSATPICPAHNPEVFVWPILSKLFESVIAFNPPALLQAPVTSEETVTKGNTLLPKNPSWKKAELSYKIRACCSCPISSSLN